MNNIVCNDKIALVKKSRGGYKGKYNLPGGGIEHTETPIEALHWEMMEEIEVTVIKEETLKIDADGLDSAGAVWLPIEELQKEQLSPFAWYA